MTRALITGCAGFIGSHLAEELLRRDWAVAGIDNFTPTYETVPRRHIVESLSRSARFRFTEGDLGEMELTQHIEDADVVFHLAARPGVRASWGDFGNSARANIFATQRLLEALTLRPELPLVFASSSSVYGEAISHPTSEDTPLRPISPYGVTKAAGEALVGAYVGQFGLHAAILRYFTVYGPRQRSDMAFHRWIRAALEGHSLLLYGDGSAIRDFTYVGDVVEATIRSAGIEEQFTILNVAGGSPASIQEVFDLIQEITGAELQVDRQEPAKGDPHATGGDTRRIQELLGWDPAWSLRRGLEAQVAWMEAHPKD